MAVLSLSNPGLAAEYSRGQGDGGRVDALPWTIACSLATCDLRGRSLSAVPVCCVFSATSINGLRRPSSVSFNREGDLSIVDSGALKVPAIVEDKVHAPSEKEGGEGGCASNFTDSLSYALRVKSAGPLLLSSYLQEPRCANWVLLCH